MPEIANDCAPLCAVSANYHSKIVDCLKDHFVFEKNYVTNESDFFASQQLEAGAGARAGDDATQFVKIAMKSLKARNEAQLQSGMFRAMQKLESVTVPEESKGKYIDRVEGWHFEEEPVLKFLSERLLEPTEVFGAAKNVIAKAKEELGMK